MAFLKDSLFRQLLYVRGILTYHKVLAIAFTPTAFWRYLNVKKCLKNGLILDVGAGGKSLLAYFGFNCISIDIKKACGVDIVASATALPFKNHAIDQVICVDVLEHIPSCARAIALEELNRVSRKKVIIHVPLEGETFYARYFTYIYNVMYRRIFGKSSEFAVEHERLGMPQSDSFLNAGFKVYKSINAYAWLMASIYLISLPPPLSLLLSWFITFVGHFLDRFSPSLAGICIKNKAH
jgi:SAM-dependent methyltransferase